MINRDFEYKGYQIHLNDNRAGVSRCDYEFFPRYSVLINRSGAWIQISACDSKREAVQAVKRYYDTFLKYN